METIRADLTRDAAMLSYADLIVANLFIEYIGYGAFKRIIEQVNPKYISCIIQINTDVSFVSDSPYIHTFERLDEVHHQMEENALTDAMEQIGYKKETRTEKALQNGKKLVRIGFAGGICNKQDNQHK